jgi:hypothetical protein
MKKIKSNKNNVESLLENLLNETQPEVRPTSMADFAPVDTKQFSIDQAIDRYFVQYEREAIPTSEVYEQVNVDKLTKYLLEQEDPEAADLGGDLDLGADDAGAGLDLGGDAEPSAPEAEPADGEQPVVNTPQINLQDFARSVARLVGNIDSLIDLRTLVINRAEKYIQSNYNDKTSKELMAILSDSYDLRPVEGEILSMNPSKFPEPKTGVTGPMGG